MELNEVRQRINQIKDVGDRAIEACRKDGKVPSQLKESIKAFDKELSNAVQTVQKENDRARVEQCIDNLEEAADQAKLEVQRADSIGDQTRSTVLQAHKEISQLKHQLH